MLNMCHGAHVVLAQRNKMEVVGGTAEETLAAMKVVIKDVCEAFGEGGKNNEIVAKIKNMMSARHIVQKK